MSLTLQNRSRKGRVSKLDRTADHLINLNQIAFRWNITAPAARARLEQAGVKLVKFNGRSCQAWFSDVRALEEKCTVTAS